MTEYKRKTKVCSSCDQDILLEFYRKIKNRNGNFTIHHKCKDCENIHQSESYFKSQMDKYLEEHKDGYFLFKCSVHGNLPYKHLFIKRYKSRNKYNFKVQCIQCEHNKRADSYGEHNISLHGENIRCQACKETKHFISFHYAELKQKYPRCHDCGIKRSKKSASASKTHRVHGGVRKTTEWYEAKFKEQNGLCAICEKPDLTRKLSVDHNHDTNAIRDLLCRRCNLAIGQLYDSPLLLRKAADYIESHG